MRDRAPFSLFCFSVVNTLYIIFFLFLFIGTIYAVLAYRFRNPFKLYYIFGKKGSGKSLYMVKFMLKYLRKGWTVYTDITDVNIPGVRLINAKDLDTFRPEENSVIFLDEVGITFDNRKFKTFTDGMRDFFKFQRKYKCIVYMNSQSFDVDKKIRDLIDRFYLATSLGNVISVYRPINRKVALVEATAQGESRVADNLKFAPFWEWKLIYMPHYFKWFDSFEAPFREVIPFDKVPGRLPKNPSPNEILRTIQRGLHK